MKAVKRAAEAVSQNMTDSLSKVGESNVISMHNYQVNIENENENKRKKVRDTEGREMNKMRKKEGNRKRERG